MSGGHLSKDFFDLVKAIGESKSKQEEDRIIVREVAHLKRQMQEKEVSKKRQKEFVIRLIYVEMLGHDASFGYIKAVELTASTNLIQKRVAYLCCSQCLSPSHEFRFMIVNQLQRDLQSSNHLEVCAALMAVCKLVTVEMIPALLAGITELLRHETEIVRKKAVMAIQQFYRLSNDSVSHLGDQIRRTLCDPSPSVMGATLCVLNDLAKENASQYKDLVPSYVSILKQITEHRLPREFDYHRIPAPWIQMRLLRILALLGQADQQTSEGMYEVLHDVMRRADTGINVGYAIIYECVRTVTTIYPNSTLLDAAASSISRFISSDNHNLKYLGVTGLASIVKDHPKYAAAHQMAVIDCLEDPDESLKRKTLDLLYRMTNPVNVEFIVGKLIEFLRGATDEFLRKDLVNRITQCAERFAPNNEWYILTMTKVFELGGEMVNAEVANNLMRLIADGTGEDEEADEELRRDAVDNYLQLLDKPVLPDILEQVIAWTVGEYGYLSDIMEPEEIAERLCELLGNTHNNPQRTRCYIIQALTKLTAHVGHRMQVVDEAVEKYKQSVYTDIQQLCFEYESMVKDMGFMEALLPKECPEEDLDPDEDLSFLNDYVEDAIQKGAPRYNPPAESDDEGEYESRVSRGVSSLKLDAYEKPSLPSQAGPKYEARPLADTQSGRSPIGGAPEGPVGFKRPTKQVWGQHRWGADLNEQKPEAASAAAGRIAGQPDARTADGPDRQHAALYNTPRVQESESEEEEEEEEEYVEPQLSEREQAAAMLFSGVPGAVASSGTSRSSGASAGRRKAGGATASKGRGRQTKQKSRAVGRKGAAEPQREKTPDKGSPSKSQPVAAASDTTPANVDLLDISFDSPTVATSNSTAVFSTTIDPFATPPSAPVTAFDAPAVQEEHTKKEHTLSTSADDPFAGMGGSPITTATTSSMNGGGLLGGMSSSSGSMMGMGSGVPSNLSLQPYSMTTPEFGSRWPTFQAEEKGKVSPSSVRTLTEYEQRIQQLNLQLIESIPATNEAIAAGKQVGTGGVCLVHAQIRSAGFVKLTIRTSDTKLSRGVFEGLKHALK